MSAAGRLPVLLLWHHHQPFYRMPDAEAPRLPWVRLHAVRGYADMLAAAQATSARMTFNFTPILLDQLEFAAQHQPADEFERVSGVPPSAMSEVEKRFVLRHFFSINWQHRVKCHPRYAELLSKRGERLDDAQERRALVEFATHDYLDLIALFNLQWIGFAGDHDAAIRELRAKQRDYSEGDLAAILSYQHRVLESVIGGYRALRDEGRIEIAMSPYAHPILPLLCDTDVAGRDIPPYQLPRPAFRYADDAKLQLRLGRETYARVWGEAAAGLWPSEGSVSDAALVQIVAQQFVWVATDDGVLRRSESTRQSGNGAFTSYEWAGDHGKLRLYFRDHGLSDAIGFRYSTMPATSAVDELVANLERIEGDTRKDPQRCVVIALDGENPWESYPDGGREFMTMLFQRLADHQRLTTMRFADHAALPAGGQIKSIHPGSWIDSNFRIWIGDPQKNAAWSELLRVRRMIDELPLDESARAVCTEWLVRAESSDWMWWFGEPFSSLYDGEFDQLFRAFLKRIYAEAGAASPPSLDVPTKRPARLERRFQPVSPISPLLDGRATSYYEWEGATHIRASQYGSVMGRSESVLTDIYYGFDDAWVYVRLDLSPRYVKHDQAEIRVRLLGSREEVVSIPLGRGGIREDDGGVAWVADSIIELAVTHMRLELSRGGDCQLAIELLEDGGVAESHPPVGGFRFVLPTVETVAANWLI